jgi:hypothetical protein
MTYWRLHYHLIWATYNREPTLTPEREKLFYGVLYKKRKPLLGSPNGVRFSGLTRTEAGL